MLMLRLLAAGALVAIIVVSWAIFGQSSDKDERQTRSPQAERGANNSGPELGAGVAKNRTGTNVPAPLRMTSSDSTETPGNGAPETTAGSLAEMFDKEDVDTRLAEKRTKMIRSVTDTLLEEGEYSAKLVEIQCKARHCRIKVTGEDQKSVVALVGAMQDERGFYGKAENLMMSRDGDEIHVYLQFAETKIDEPGAGE